MVLPPVLFRLVRQPWLLLLPFVVLAALTLYWVDLLKSHEELRHNAHAQAGLRAVQVANAMSQQVSTLVQGIDYALLDMGADYSRSGYQTFEESVERFVGSYPRDTILQVSLTDAAGRVIYSSLTERPKAISIADREHFLVHLDQEVSSLYISKPVFGRLSQAWSIQFSRQVRRHGKFAGVLVASVSPSYFSSLFHEVSAGDRDVVFLFNQNLDYLARTRMQDEVMGRQLPESYRWITELTSNRFDSRAGPDGLARVYGIHSVARWPLYVGVGIELQSIMAPVDEAIESSLFGNLLGSLLILLAVGWIYWLLYRQWRQQSLLKAIYDVLPIGILQADENGTVQEGNASAARLLGLPESGLRGTSLKNNPATAQPLVHMQAMPAGKQLPLAEAWSRIAAGDSLHNQEIRLQPRPGQLHYLVVNAVPAPTAEGGSVAALVDVTQRCVAEARLALREQQLDMALRGAELELWDWNLESGNLELLHPRQADPVCLPSWQALIHSDDWARVKLIFDMHLVGHSPMIEVEYRVRDDERWRWVQCRGRVMDRDEQNRPVRALGTHLDVTQRKLSESERRATQRKLEKLTAQLPSVVFQLRRRADGLYAMPYANPALGTLCGVDPLAVRDQADAFFAVIVPADREECLASLEHSSCHLQSWRMEFRIVNPLGEIRWMLGHASPEKDLDGSVLWHGYLNDISERKAHEDDLVKQASTDGLTGLANRRSWLVHANRELTRCRRYPDEADCAVVMLDIDHFKRVNDSHGHAVGDQVLQELARRMQAGLRETDCLGRMGGEEFAILLPQTSQDGACLFAERLCRKIAGVPFATEAGALVVTISLGVSQMQSDDASVDCALARADGALYAAKSGGRNRVEAAVRPVVAGLQPA